MKSGTQFSCTEAVEPWCPAGVRGVVHGGDGPGAGGLWLRKDLVEPELLLRILDAGAVALSVQVLARQEIFLCDTPVRPHIDLSRLRMERGGLDLRPDWPNSGEDLAAPVSSDGSTQQCPPDGSTVAMAGDTGEIVSIDVSTGDERRSTGLGAPVYWLNYSDDGELLVSAAEDGGVSLWDATTLDLLGTVHPPHHGEPVPAGAQFIGDTHEVAIASHDGKVYRWETDLDRAIEFACQMAGRNLTEEEWEQFLPAQPYQSVCPDE